MTHATSGSPALREILTDRWLVSAIAVALLLRVVLALLVDGRMTAVGDEREYLQEALDLVRDGSLETGGFVRPPLYFLFHALVVSLVGIDAWGLTVRLLQSVASCATALYVYRATLRVGGRRAARIAAVFLLFDPTLIAFTHLLWPETLFLLAVAIVFDGIADLDETRVGRAIGLGCVTGAAMLLKPVFGLFTLALAASWVSRLGLWRGVRLALIFGSATAVVISPWVIRNQLRYGGAILLENQGSYNLWSGNAEESPKHVLATWVAIDGQEVRNRIALQKGWEAIREDPTRFAERYRRRALNFFGFEYFAVRHFALGGYPEVPRNVVLGAFWVIQVGWALALLSAAAGLGPAWRDPPLRAVLMYGVVFVVLVSAMVVTTRFRVPFAFVTAIASGIGVDRLLSGRVGWRSWILVSSAVVVLAISASRPVFAQFFAADFETTNDLVEENWIYFRY